MTTKKQVPFWAIWNMSFGFLGIQFGRGLQMANMSAIYTYLGADEGSLAILWLAAPLTGVLIQPLVGQSSDRIWTRLGRRRPFILAGALLSSAALLLMPNCSAVWMAAGLLWVLDGSINASMQPFRALVADNLPPEQGAQGFAIQSLFIGLGGTVSSALPWMMTNWFGVAASEAGKGHIPASVRLSFYLGAVAFLGAVLWTIFKTTEIPPSDEELATIRARKFDWTLGLLDVVKVIPQLPRRMWELGLVQFFTWIGMFCLWIYFSPAVARHIFHAVPGSVEMEASGSWASLCFGIYNLVCFLFSFALLGLARKLGPKLTHISCLLAGAVGLASVKFVHDKNLLFVSMIFVGIAWSSILSMPYEMLTRSLPKAKVGVMMGMFNLFIVLPQVVAASGVMDWLMGHVLGNDPVNALIMGAGCMITAAVLTLLVVSYKRSEEHSAPEEPALRGAGH
jgi:maltose/moltooligosaccharide transporter